MVNILPALQETHLDTGLMPGLGKSAGRGHSNFFFGESHGQRSLVGYSPRGCKELDVTEVTGGAYMQAVSSHLLPS